MSGLTGLLTLQSQRMHILQVAAVLCSHSPEAEDQGKRCDSRLDRLILLSELPLSMDQRFVPDNFAIPTGPENSRLRIRMLTVNDVVKDYDAVATSLDDLQGSFGPKSKWPPKDLSLEQDLIDLGWHQKEFQRRSSFTYAVMNPDESRCLGGVAVYPPSKTGYDAEVYVWVRKSELASGLDEFLFLTVRKWIEQEWPFKNVAYPGREISWGKWESL